MAVSDPRVFYSQREDEDGGSGGDGSDDDDEDDNDRMVAQTKMRNQSIPESDMCGRLT